MNIARRISSLGACIAVVAVAVLCYSVPARAGDDATDARGLVDKSAATLEGFLADSHWASFHPALAKARAVLILPQVLKAGFIFGGSGGSGVLMVRDGKGGWVGPAFYTMGSGSIGFAAGVQSAEMVLFINSQKALDSMYSNKLKLGADASAAFGPAGVGTGAELSADFLVYAKAQGVYAGMSVDGAVLDVRQSLNEAFYGKAVSPVDIVVKHAVSSPDAAKLQSILTDAGK